jgi:hypothetical protein
MTQDVERAPVRSNSLETPDVFASRRIAVAQALRDTSYEVLPLRSAEESIVSAVPRTVPLSVTMTSGKGVQPTIELTERLTEQGYTVNSAPGCTVVPRPGAPDRYRQPASRRRGQ